MAVIESVGMDRLALAGLKSWVDDGDRIAELTEQLEQAEAELQRALHVIDTTVHELGGPCQLADPA